MIASLQAVGICADVRGACAQSEKGLRKGPIFCNLPPDGIPGEDNLAILIELLAEINDLITLPRRGDELF